MGVAPDIFRGPRFAVLAAVTDACLLWIALAVAARATDGLEGTSVLLGLLLATITFARVASKGLYGERGETIGVADIVRLAAGAIVHGTGLAVIAAVVVGAGSADSRALVVAGAVGGILLPGGRIVLATARDHARLRGYGVSHTLIVGAGGVGLDLERKLRGRRGLGLVPVGFLDDAPGRTFSSTLGRGPLLGRLSDLEAVVASRAITHVVVAFSHRPDSEIVDIVRRCRVLGVRVSVVPRFYENVSARQWTDQVTGVPLVRTSTVHPHAWQFAVKHAVGRGVAVVAVVLAAPLLLAIAAAVRIGGGPGPILFRQRRIGRDGQVFDILKFRTMRVADERPDAGLRSRIRDRGTGPGGVEADDRRTRVGTLLRRTSLDELPQLLNVLQGHMSLVGPRPERPDFVELFGGGMDRYDDRHRVKSGITGWAQVNGLRGQTSMVDRIELDNWYIENWSLWLDVKILLLTPFEVLRSRAESTTGSPQPDLEPAGRSTPTGAATRALPERESESDVAGAHRGA